MIEDNKVITVEDAAKNYLEYYFGNTREWNIYFDWMERFFKFGSEWQIERKKEFKTDSVTIILPD